MNAKTRVIFMLWGNNAKEKIKVITNHYHKILTAAHPRSVVGKTEDFSAAVILKRQTEC